MSGTQAWSPGGGGGFGPPPGGGGFGPPPGGGGFGPPPGGGGEDPIGRIPFTPADERNIAQTALFMRISGGLFIVNSLFSIAGALGIALYRGGSLLAPACGGAIGMLFQLFFAALLFVSAASFGKIASNDGQDQQHLAAGLGRLRWYFLSKAIVYLLAMLACCAGVILALVMGAAMASAIGNFG